MVIPSPGTCLSNRLRLGWAAAKLAFVQIRDCQTEAPSIHSVHFASVLFARQQEHGFDAVLKSAKPNALRK